MLQFGPVVDVSAQSNTKVKPSVCSLLHYLFSNHNNDMNVTYGLMEGKVSVLCTAVRVQHHSLLLPFVI